MTNIILETLKEKRDQLNCELLKIDNLIKANPASDLCKVWDEFKALSRAQKRDLKILDKLVDREANAKKLINKQKDISGLIDKSVSLEMEISKLNREIGSLECRENLTKQ